MADGIIGKAKIEVSAVLTDFHKDIKRAIEDGKQLGKQGIEVKLIADTDKLEEAKDYILDLRKETKDPFELKVDVDTKDAASEIDNLIKDIKSEKVNLKLKFDTSEAHDSAQSFVDEYHGKELNMSLHLDTLAAEIEISTFEHMHEVMTTHLLLDWANADSEMKSFASKIDSYFSKIAPISLPTVPGSPSHPRRASVADSDVYGGTLGSFLNRKDLQASNFVNEMLKSMKTQLGVGFDKIYTPYIHLVADGYNFLSRPVAKMKENYKDVENFEQLFKTTFKSLKAGSDNAKKSFSDLKKSITGIGPALKTGMGDPKSIVGRFRALFGNPFKDMQFSVPTKMLVGAFGDLFAPLGNIINNKLVGSVTGAFKRFSGAIKSLPNMTKADFLNAGRSMAANLGRGIVMDLKTIGKAFKSLGKSIGHFFYVPFDEARYWALVTYDKISGGAQALGKKVATAGKSIKDNLTSSLSNLGTKAAAGFNDLQARTRLLAADLLHFGKSISKPFHFDTLPLKAQLNGAMNHLRSFSAGVKGFAQAQGIYFRKMGQAIGEELVGVGRRLRGLGPRITQPISRAFGFVGQHMRSFGGRASRVMSGVGDSMSRAFGRGLNNTRVLARSVGRFGMAATKLMGTAMGRVGRGLMRSTALFKGISTVFGRMGKYMGGFMRIGVGAFAAVGGAIFKTLMPALTALMVGLGAISAQAAIGGIAALAGLFINAAAGAMLLAPAMIAVAGVSFAALKMGLKDVKAGVSAAFSADTAEEFEKAIQNMPASVQAIARSFREFKGPMDEMKRNVQNNMLEGLAPKISTAMHNLFPVYKAGLEGISKAWNGSFKRALDELGSEQAQRGLKASMDGAVLMAKNMEPVLANMIAAFGSLIEQGAKFLGPIGKYFADASESFKNWAESLKQIDPTTGVSKFDSIIQRASESAKVLKGILGGIFGIMIHIFQAAADVGLQGGALQGVAGALQTLSENTKRGSEGFEKLKGFMSEALNLATQLKAAIEPIFSIAMDLITAIAGLGANALPGVVAILSSFANGLTPFVGALQDVGRYLSDMLSHFSGIFGALPSILVPLIVGLVSGLNNALSPLGDVLNNIAPELAELANALQPVFETVGTALGSIFSALEPMLGSFISMLTSFMPLLNVFLGGLGALITEVIKAVTPIFAGKDGAMSKLFASLMPVVDTLFKNLINIVRALSPAFDAVGVMIVMLIEAVQPLLPLLGEVIDRIGKGIVDAINWVTPFIPVIIDVFKTLVSFISSVLVVAIKLIIDVWDTVWPPISRTVRYLVREIVVPMFNIAADCIKVFSEVVKFIFEKVVAPLFRFLMDIVEAFANFMTWVFDHTAIPALHGLKSAFKFVVDGIKGIWEGLRKILSAPIKFFIETVVNNGVIKGWNFVNDKLGGKLGEDLSPLSSEGLSFATGGVMPGYTPGRDVHKFWSPTGGGLELSGGEAIMRPEWTQAVGGPAAVERMNKAARRGKFKPYEERTRTQQNQELNRAHKHALGGILRFAEGGVVEAMTRIVHEKYPHMTMTSGWRNTADNHGRGLAADFSDGSGNTPAMIALANDIADTYPGSMELIHEYPGFERQIKNGQFVGGGGGSYGFYVGAGNHADHVHWAMDTPPNISFGGGVFEGGSSMAGAIAGGFRRMVSMFSKFFEPFFNPIKKSIMGDAEQFDGNYALNTAKGLASKSIDSTVNWAKDQLKALVPGSGGGSSSGGVDLSGVSGAVADQVQEVFARHGWTGQQWEDAKWIIQQESGFNPEAVNPSSGAFGLFQFNPMGGDTLGTYLPDRSTDPAVQANAGARYIKDRYGDPSAARAFWEANHWYDQGGIAKGVGYMQKAVLEPERVLSPQHTKAFDTFIYGLLPELIKSFKDNPRDLKGNFDRAIKAINGFRDQWRTDTRERVSSDLAEGFYQRQMGNEVYHDLTKVTDAIIDPYNYLAAEKIAQEKLDKRLKEERDAAKKAEEEALKEKEKAEDKEREVREKAEGEARREKEKEEDKAAKTDEEKQALKDQREAAKDAEKEAKEAEREKERESRKEEQEALRKKQEEEDKRIEELKATGEYYYGYKTLNENAENPLAYKPTQEETMVRNSLTAMAEPVGLSGLANKVGKWYDIGRQVEAGAKIAAPAWAAALAGDSSGLAHNIVVSDAALAEQGMKELETLIPSMAGGITEMFMSSGAAQTQPFIGTVNSGMTQAELFETLNRYEQMRSRQRTGTVRTR